MKNKVRLSIIFLLVVIFSFGIVFADEPMLYGTAPIGEVLIMDNPVISPYPKAISSFTDVDDYFWACGYIERWVEDGVINGYEDDTYRPNNAITRAEFVAMLDRIFIPNAKADLTKFKDIDVNAWYYESMQKAVSMGIIKGVSETEIAPNAFITRQEAMTIVARILNIAENGSNKGSIDKFVDKDKIADWAEDAIALMTESGYVNGYADGTVRPTGNITRAEVAKILDKTFAIVIREPGTYDLGKVEGNVVVVAEDVVIVNAEISGSVYVGSDLTTESVTTENVEVEDIVSIVEDVEPIEDDNKGSSTSSRPTVSVGIITSGDVYVFSADGTISKDAYLTVDLDGVNIISKKSIATETAVESAIKTIFESLDYNKVVNTVKAKQSAVIMKYEMKVIATEDSQVVQDYIADMNSSGVDYLIIKTLDVLSRDELIELANDVCNLGT